MSIQHSDIGAYSLGLLEPQDRRAFEDHLAGCSSCAAELNALSPMAELLRGIEPVEAPGAGAGQPAEVAVTQLIRRRAARERKRTRWQVVLGAAAAVVLLAGGIAVGVATAPGQSGPGSAQLTVVGQRHSATDPVTGVAGTVGLVSKAWGTQVTMDLSRVRGPLECELVAVSRTGERRVVVGWLVPAAGYGVPGHPGHLILEGGTSISQNDLARVDVDVVRGRTLLTIPV
jgi:hypothetical protein